jgi:L-amino acid N-acyltransferase YncA
MPSHASTATPGATRIIRLAEPRDAAALAAIYAPSVRDTVTSFEIDPPDAAEMARRLAAVTTVAPWLVLEEDGRVCGFAYASRHRDRAAYQWCVDATVYVAAEAHRRGVGKALYRALFGLLAAQGFYAVHAGITLPNAASVGLHESLGFRPIAVYPKVGWKQHAWHDVGWWQLELRPREDGIAPDPPAPFDAGRAAAALRL